MSNAKIMNPAFLAFCLRSIIVLLGSICFFTPFILISFFPDHKNILIEIACHIDTKIEQLSEVFYVDLFFDYLVSKLDAIFEIKQPDNEAWRYVFVLTSAYALRDVKSYLVRTKDQLENPNPENPSSKNYFISCIHTFSFSILFLLFATMSSIVVSNGLLALSLVIISYSAYEFIKSYASGLYLTVERYGTVFDKEGRSFKIEDEDNVVLVKSNSQAVYYTIKYYRYWYSYISMVLGLLTILSASIFAILFPDSTLAFGLLFFLVLIALRNIFASHMIIRYNGKDYRPYTFKEAFQYNLDESNNQQLITRPVRRHPETVTGTNSNKESRAQSSSKLKSLIKKYSYWRKNLTASGKLGLQLLSLLITSFVLTVIYSIFHVVFGT